MNILVTNDDGITSEGISVLADVLGREHDVWIAAPDRERSAVSHGITFREPVKFHRIGDRTYSCSGTPADCVLYALHGAVPVQFDLVVSGINRGENIGTDIIYSGTVSAARQAVLHGIPGIAVSAGALNPSYVEAAKLLLRELPALLDISHMHMVLNINVPDGYDPEEGIAAAVPCIKAGGNQVHPYYRSADEVFFFLSEFREEKLTHIEAFTDADALRAGKASVTALAVQPMVHGETMERVMELYAKRGSR